MMKAMLSQPMAGKTDEWYSKDKKTWEIITDEHLGNQFKDMKMIFHEDTSMVEYLT